MNKTFKARLRVPTKEQYAYLEVDAEGTPEELIGAYTRLTECVAGNAGLPDKEWNQALDTYRLGKGMSPEVFERMNERQRWLIHELDKSNSRFERAKIIKEAKEKE